MKALAKEWWWLPTGVVAVIAAVVVVEQRSDVGDAWAGVVGALGGAALGLVGERLRVRHEQRTESSVWARDRRFAAYDDFFRAAVRYERALGLRMQHGAGQDELDEHQMALNDWRSALTRVRIFGSDEARSIAGRFTERTGHGQPSAATQQALADSRQDRHRDLWETRQSVRQAQEDLRVAIEFEVAEMADGSA